MWIQWLSDVISLLTGDVSMDQNLHSLFELAFTDYLYKDLTELYFKQISLACQ
jgi:hypothetical protein